jgi:chromosome segregation ATPase
MNENIEETRLVAEIPKDLKRLVDAHPDDNKKLVKDALWDRFGGRHEAAIERRIEEIEDRLGNVKRERNERNREIEDLKEKRGFFRKQLEKREEMTDKTLDEAREALEETDRDPNNPAIQNWAEKLNMTATELIEQL